MVDRAAAQMIGEEVANSLKRTGFASGSMTGQAMRDQAWTGITNAGSALGKVSTGAMDFKGVIEQVTKTFGIFGGVGDVLGTVFSGTINHLKDMNDAMLLSARSGVSFNQNLFNYTKSLADAGISFENFNKLISTAGKQIFGSGLNAQHSADIFLNVSKSLMESRNVLTMNMMGIDMTEFQDQIAITTDLFKGLDRTRYDVNKLIVESTIAAAVEIDNMARLTGRSRQEIQKDLDQQQSSKLTRMARQSLDGKQLENLNRMGPMLAQLPEGMSDVYVQLMRFKNTVTKDATEQLKAMDMVAPGTERLMRQMANTKDEKELERLKSEFQFLYAKGMADAQAKGTFDIMPTIQNGIAKGITENMAGGKSNYGMSLSQMYRDSGGNYEKFLELEQSAARFRADMQKNIGLTNQAGGSGAVVSQILQLFDRSLKLGPQAVAAFMKSFEDTLGEKLTGVDSQGMMGKILDLQNMTPERAKEIYNKLIPSTAVDLDKGRKEGNVPTDMPERYGVAADKPLHVSVTNFPPLTPADQSNSTDPNRRRAGGSLNATGSTKIDKWFENFDGMEYILDNDESVVRRDQSVAFAIDALTQNGMLPAMAAGLRAAANTSGSNDDALRELTSVISSLPSQLVPSNLAGVTQPNEDKEILAQLLDRLNTKMDTLINTVEDGSKGTVRAVRSQSNLIG